MIYKKTTKAIVLSVPIFLLALPFLAMAASGTPTVVLLNPIGEDNPMVIIANVIRAILGVLGAVTLLMFVYGGFMLIFSAGNEERLKKGRETLIWSIIGLAVVLSSYSILSYLFTILAQ